jgi:hypothetical protein
MELDMNANARLFYRCGLQRLDEARILRKADQLTTGAVYLAGYCVECMLKALILNELTNAEQTNMLKSFRGGKAHDFEWLREQYRRKNAAPFPSAITRSFVLVNDWSTALRYLPKNMKTGEIDAFLRAADDIKKWAAGRL